MHAPPFSRFSASPFATLLLFLWHLLSTDINVIYDEAPVFLASPISLTSPQHQCRGDLQRDRRWLFCTCRWLCILLSSTRCSITSPPHQLEAEPLFILSTSRLYLYVASYFVIYLHPISFFSFFLRNLASLHDRYNFCLLNGRRWKIVCSLSL